MKKCFEINSGRFFLSSNFLFRIAKNSTALTFVEDFFFSVSWMKFLKRRKKHSEELNVFSITKAVRIFRLKKKKYFRKKLSNETCHIVTVVFSRLFFSLIFYLCQFFRGQFNLLLWIFKIWMELGRDQNVWISFFFRVFSRFCFSTWKHWDIWSDRNHIGNELRQPLQPQQPRQFAQLLVALLVLVDIHASDQFQPRRLPRYNSADSHS